MSLCSDRAYLLSSIKKGRVMSWLKKEEIVELVARMQKADNWSVCFAKAKTLKSRGKDIVDIVLEEMFRLKETGAFAQRDKFSPYCLIISIEPYVEPRHEKQLVDILLWDEVALVCDGSMRFHLFRMLRRIGSAKVIPYLEKLSVLVKGVVYNYHDDPEVASPKVMEEYNQEEIRQTIDAIRARTGTS